MSEPSVEQLRQKLLESFDDYHSSIRKQTQLLDALIEAVRREERARARTESDDSAQALRAGVLGLLGRTVRG
ncbi:MAG TPA: hypothetical protein VF034_12365 [Gemmatimonadaceae bacterium]|jgi:hypothetical protein